MWKVYFKELLELTRDRKTLIFTIVLPTLIIPVILFGFLALAINISEKAEKEILTYGVIGQGNYPELAELLLKNESLKFIEVKQIDNLENLVKQNKIKFGISIPSDIQKTFSKGHRVKIKLIYNDASPLSKTIYERVDKVVKSLGENLLEIRIAKFNLTKLQKDGLVKPIQLEKKTTAEKRESSGEIIGSFLPYILLIIALSGAMYPAIDIGAGEKERGTLETLLLTPILRYKIVLAKFFVLFTTSFTAVFLCLLSFAVWILVLTKGNLLSALSGKASGDLNLSLSGISMLDIFLIFTMLIPAAAIFASLSLTISIYARNFKEAQNYMTPLTMLILFPVMIVILPGVKLDWFWASVPLTNIALAIKELVKGTVDYSMLLVIFGSTTIVAGLLLWLCSWWFQREQVLFRS